MGDTMSSYRSTDGVELSLGGQQACESDFDCGIGALCYRDVSWLDPQLLVQVTNISSPDNLDGNSSSWNSNNSSFYASGLCECSTWYGFTSSDGINCDRTWETPASRFKLIGSMIMAIIDVIIILFAFPVNIRLARIFRRGYCRIKSSPVHVSLVCNLFRFVRRSVPFYLGNSHYRRRFLSI